MTPIATARAFARQIAKDLGHDVGRLARSPYDRRCWVTSCQRCGRTLSVAPHPSEPRGEWLITGNASRMKCSTAVRTYGEAARLRRNASRRIRRKDVEAL